MFNNVLLVFYYLQAVMLHLLMDHAHKIPFPTFGGFVDTYQDKMENAEWGSFSTYYVVGFLIRT